MNEHAAGAGIGMDKMEIRHMLLLAGGQPLRAAVALGADGKAIILLDRHKQPRALERDIKQQAPGSRLHRFGTFAADEGDRKLGRFTLNRAAPGMARKLVKALKGTGLRRVEIGLEDGSAEEAAEDVDGEEDVAVYDPAERARHTALSHELRTLIERIAGMHDERRHELVGLAEAVQRELKQDRLDPAAKAITALRGAIG